MITSKYKSYDELPLFLNAKMVAQVLGVSPSSGYELMHEPGFPVLKVGSRMVVPKEQFIRWVQEHTGDGSCASLQALCASMRGGAGPFPEVLRAGFGPVSEALRGRGAKQDNPQIPHLPAVRRAPVSLVLARPGERIYPPSGGASRAFVLPQAAAKRILQAEARTHFPVGGHPTGPIDNNLITVAGYTGYPRKDLVWCASQRWGHAIPDLLRR